MTHKTLSERLAAVSSHLKASGDTASLADKIELANAAIAEISAALTQLVDDVATVQDITRISQAPATPAPLPAAG